MPDTRWMFRQKVLLRTLRRRRLEGFDSGINPGQLGRFLTASYRLIYDRRSTRLTKLFFEFRASVDVRS